MADPNKAIANIPDFSGESTDKIESWCLRIEYAFASQNIQDPARLLVIPIKLNGQALLWYDRIHRTTPFQTWAAFVQAITAEFSPQKSLLQMDREINQR
ncbi:unnamed protein product, partial [Didymodactylos carnosus]